MVATYASNLQFLDFVSGHAHYIAIKVCCDLLLWKLSNYSYAIVMFIRLRVLGEWGKLRITCLADYTWVELILD